VVFKSRQKTPLIRPVGHLLPDVEGRITSGKRGTLPMFSEPLKKKRGAAEKAVPRFTTLSLPLNSKRYIFKADY
jgi:hypothetical protein